LAFFYLQAVAVNTVLALPRSLWQDCLLIYCRPPASVCIQLGVVTFGHVTKMAVTPFDPP